MSNPFYQSNMNTNNASFRDVYRMMSNSKNPMEVFMNIAKTNPNLRPALELMQNGNNPQAVFMQLCQQRGINPQDFLKSITG